MAKATKESKKIKICDICGDIGFMEDIVTCHCCKMASEHIYCMQVLLFKAPDFWCCDGCQPKAHVVHHGKVQDMHTEKIYSTDSKRAKSPTKEGPHLHDDTTPEEINDGRKQLNGKHVMHPSYPNAAFKAVENAKVKFIPLEEVAFTYHARTSSKAGNSGASCHHSDHPNIICPTNSRKASTMMFRSPSLATTSVLNQPNEATVNAEAGPSLGKIIMLREGVIDDKEGNMQMKKVSGFGSSSKCIVSAASDFSFDASTFHIDDGMKYRTKCKALGETSAAPTGKKCSGRSTVADENYSQLNQNEETKCVDVRVQHTRDKSKKVGTGDSSGGIVCSAAQCKRSTSKEKDLPLTLLINPNEKLLNCPAPEACWKGAFEVFDMVNHTYSEIQAHFPSQVSPKAYEISKKLPLRLKLNMLPQRDAWPNIFQLDPPTYDDIGLYFFPSQSERPREKYFRLLERINSHDFAMQAWIGDVELLIYPSKQLRVQSHRIDGQTYLWGMFRHVKHRKHHQCRHDPLSSFSPPADLKSNEYGLSTLCFEGNDQEVDMEIDMEGGKEIGWADKPIRKRNAAPGFPFRSPISQEASPVCRPLVKFPLEKTSSTRSDIPHGFSRILKIKQGRISPVANRKQLLPEIYDSPLRSPELSQTSAVMLPLFPQKSEIRKANEIDNDNMRQIVSADLSLSRPEYVMDGNGWVSTTPRASFYQDGCGEDLQLKL